MKLDATNPISISTPGFAAQNERLSLKLTIHGPGGSLADIAAYVLPPIGQAINITDFFQNVSSVLPVAFMTLFQTEYTFQQKGLYVFLVHETSSGDVWIADTYCSEWASRIDQPVSDLNKQRADLQRVFGRLNRG